MVESRGTSSRSRRLGTSARRGLCAPVVLALAAFVVAGEGRTALGQDYCIDGTVTDCVSGQPLSGATVQWNSLTTTTDANGSYEFLFLPSGTCATGILSFFAPGHDFVSFPFQPICTCAIGFNVVDVCLQPTAPPTFTSFCPGSGTCTPCPCANSVPSGVSSGCRNATGSGATLVATGTPSASADTLSFTVGSATTSSFAVLVSADNRLPMAGPCPVGSGVTSASLDGLRCVGGALQRHGTRATNVFGTTASPWGPPGGPAGGLIAQGGFTPGQTRHFQVFYREAPLAGCGSGQNTTQGVSLTVAP